MSETKESACPIPFDLKAASARLTVRNQTLVSTFAFAKQAHYSISSLSFNFREAEGRRSMGLTALEPSCASVPEAPYTFV